MKKECHGAARRDMIVGSGGLVENGLDGIYGFGKGFERVQITEKDIGPRVIEIEGREAKFWGWETWFGMWTASRFPVADPIIRGPDQAPENLESTYSSPSSFLRSPLWASSLGRMGRGEGVGSVGAADIARGIANGLGVVRALRVITVVIDVLYESLLPVSRNGLPLHSLAAK